MHTDTLNELQNLNLMNIVVSDRALEYIGKVCGKLSAIDLYNNVFVTDDGILHILKGTSNLKRLYLQKCKLVGFLGVFLFIWEVDRCYSWKYYKVL